jgi:hypothetical protein
MKAHRITITPVKTYKTAKNAIAAVEKLFANAVAEKDVLRYTIMQRTDGRHFPVFIGTKAIDHGVHFHFNVIA